MRYGQYFGTEVRRASFGGLLLTEHSYLGHTILPEHQHANAYFMLVLYGGLTERSGSTEFECGSSTLLFHREGARHTNIFGASPARCFGVEFDPKTLQRLDWSWRDQTAATWVTRSPATVALAYKLRNELQHPDVLSGVIIEGLALTLLGESVRAAKLNPGHRRTLPHWLRAADELIRDESLTDLSVTAVARCVGVHAVTLARSYRAVFGKTVGEAIRELRLQHAVRMLSETRLPITVIALTSGFADHSHFSRAFRRQFGVTPNEFRATTRSPSAHPKGTASGT